MNTISPLDTGRLGLQRALADASRQVAKIAAATGTASDRPSDYTRPLVRLITDRDQAEAAARIIKTTDEILGSLIDIKA